MTDSSSSAFDRTLASIGKCDGDGNYREWWPKIRQAIGLYRPNMLLVLDGEPCPTDIAEAVQAAEWRSTNNKLFSVLYFSTTGSANITVKAHMATTPGDLGDGVAAWKALKDRFDGNNKEARRAARVELFSSKMEEASDPQDFFSNTDDLRDRLKDMGETISDEVYEALLLDALPGRYEFIRQRHYENTSLGITSLKNTAINYYIDKKKRTASIAGRGAAMMVSDGGKGSCCKECGHCKPNGAKANKGKWKKGKKESGSDPSPKWCSFHKTNKHSDGECFKQREINALAEATAKATLAITKDPAIQSRLTNGTAHLAHQAESEPLTFGFSYAAIGASLDEVEASSINFGSPPARSSTKPTNCTVPEGIFGAF